MSDLRISGLAPSAPAVAGRPAQKAFFDAALGRAAGASVQRPAQAVAAAAAPAAPPATLSATPSAAGSATVAPAPGGRPLRPGSMIDIRV